MPNINVGDRVTIFIDGKICSGIFVRYGGYAGLYEKRVYVQFENDIHKYYKKARFISLIKEYKLYIRNLLMSL